MKRRADDIQSVRGRREEWEHQGVITPCVHIVLSSTAGHDVQRIYRTVSASCRELRD